jgi:hypothetical protein
MGGKISRRYFVKGIGLTALGVISGAVPLFGKGKSLTDMYSHEELVKGLVEGIEFLGYHTSGSAPRNSNGEKTWNVKKKLTGKNDIYLTSGSSGKKVDLVDPRKNVVMTDYHADGSIDEFEAYGEEISKKEAQGIYEETVKEWVQKLEETVVEECEAYGRKIKIGEDDIKALERLERILSKGNFSKK